MHINLEKIAISAVGYFLFLKLYFWIFSPTESLVAVGVPCLLFLLYGVQSVKWCEESSVTLFGLQIYQKKSYIVQIRIWGIIPITKPRAIQQQVNLLDGIQVDGKVIGKHLLLLLPLGGLP